MTGCRHAWQVWTPLLVIFMLSLYLNRDQLKPSEIILPNEISYEITTPETNRVTTNNEDIAIKTLEEWKIYHPLPSIEDGENSDLKTRFIDRHKLLKEGCKSLQKNHETLDHQWAWQSVPGVDRNPKTNLSLMKIQHEGRYGICVIPKVGSTTWKDHYVNQLLKNQTIKTNRTINMIQIRHPLDRLRSAYTDKFLGGEPISTFDGEYIKEIESREGWSGMWNAYWLPALISTGRLEMPTNFHEVVKKLKNENSFYKRFRSVTHKLYPSKVNEKTEKFANVSFTFEEFLTHVLWTKDLGLGDHHWIPQSELCNVCAGDFEYVLKLENIKEEIPFVF